MIHEDTKRTALAIAEDALRGALDPIDASNRVFELASLKRIVPEDVWELFSKVSSASEGYPIGEVRQLWRPDAMTKKDSEIASFRDSMRPQILRACEQLRGTLEQA